MQDWDLPGEDDDDVVLTERELERHLIRRRSNTMTTAKPDPARAPAARARADLYVDVHKDQSVLVLFRAGDRIPAEYADRPTIPATVDEDGVPLPHATAKPKPSRLRGAAR